MANNNTQAVRVWIIASSQADFLRSINRGGRANDIILQYSQEAKGITLIAGYLRGGLNLPKNINPIISLERLIDLFSNKSRIISDISNGQAHKLLSEEWRILREVIISDNDQLRLPIEELESLQTKYYMINGASSIIFDMFWSAIEVFNPNEFRYMKSKLKEERKRLKAKSEETNSFDDTMTDFISNLHESGIVKSVSPQDPTFPKLIVSTPNRRKPKLDEQGTIFSDNSKTDPQFQRKDDHLEPEYREYAMRLIDSEGRELFIFLSHRRGLKNNDVLGSDFIYQSRIQKYFLFIQYKLLNAKKTLRINEHNRSQLDEMLKACREIQVCDHYIIDEDRYIETASMRLGTCPFFYKLIPHDPKIMEENNIINGNFIQSCMVHQLTTEFSNTLDSSTHLNRGLTYQAFIELAKKGQIGSKADSYDAIFTRVSPLMKDGIFFFAMETEAGLPTP